MSRFMGCGLALVCAFAGATDSPGGEPIKSAVVDSVAAEDLLLKVKIIGALGIPLGEIVQIKGEWVESDRSKPSEIRFRVDVVNGKASKKRPEFLRSQVEGWSIDKKTNPAVGDVWSVRALETGGIVGLPEGAFEQPVQQPNGYKFLTRLFIIKRNNAKP